MVDSAFGYNSGKLSPSENRETLKEVADEEGYEFGILNNHGSGLKSYRLDDASEADFSTVVYDSETDSYAMVDRGLTDDERIILEDEETDLEDVAFWPEE